MRKMFSQKQVEELAKEITKQNSTQLYKHSFKLVGDDLEPINNAPEFFIVNNDPTKLTFTFTADTIASLDNGDYLDIFPIDKVLFPYAYYSVDSGMEWIFFAPLEFFQETDDPEQPTEFSLLISDFVGNLELTIIDSAQDNRDWIGMMYLDTVTKL